MATYNPFSIMGKRSRADGHRSGWIYATDADTGVWKWRLKSNYPIVAAWTPTAGGVLFFGDVGGHFYALDSATGQKLWGEALDGALAGRCDYLTWRTVRKKWLWQPVLRMSCGQRLSGPQR